jgi:HEAT repeat protein
VEITGPGTIDDLVTDAERLQFTATPRLVIDWTSKGLLDRPARKAKGRGLGSEKALYPAAQRELFLTLLDKRRQGAVRIPTLARIPIFIWLIWGDDWVPTRQALLAHSTWLGVVGTSQEQARRSASEMLGLLDHPLAQDADRRALRNELADIAYKGRLDDASRLEAAVRQVFEPPSVFRRSFVRAAGHPAAPLTADTVVGLVTARATAAVAIKRKQVSVSDMQQVRQMYLASRAEYAVQLPVLRAQTQAPYAALYSDGGVQAQVDHCALDLLTLIGLLKRTSTR